MSNAYYQPGTRRADRVRELFNRIARRYDLINDLQSFGLHRLWKRKLANMAGDHPGTLALDLCCGTGDIALALARRGFRVVGVDFSLPMLRMARARSSLPVPSICQPAAVGAQTASATELRCSGSNVLWLLGDALLLSISPQSVDLVAISYGLRNLADIPAGLTEISRVLQPGGRLLILDFGKPAHRLWRELYFAYLKICVPVLGWFFCGDSAAYGYILASLRTYPAQAGIADALRQAGFAQVQVRSFLGGVTSIHSAVKPRQVARDRAMTAAAHVPSPIDDLPFLKSG